ncbi:MAG TPA: hypothetical protein VME17_19960 [Bryobacteraceae bacterium]|nr:hypothetical protein [Bryobacteraceae bacterium]
MRFVATFLLPSLLLVPAAGSAATLLTDPSPDQIDQIIAKFAAKEAAFAKARGNYTYRQTAEVMTLDDSGAVTGKWEEVTDILFTPEGQRIEKVAYAPVSTLTAIQLDPGDMQDLREVQPFVLTTSELPKYFIRYLGREQLDEISCYAFAVKPKKLEPGQRYFEGIAWVDDRDLQIVKTYGRGVGITHGDYQYPKFETYRQQIDGKYWFPTYTIANTTLHFKENDQRIKEIVKYQDYKQFKSDVQIKYDTEAPSKTPDQAPPPTKKP